MTSSRGPSPPDGSVAAAPGAGCAPCPSCNGNGSIVMSLCCGRGCATCTGDQLQAVECFRCRGSGQLPPPAGQQ